MDYQKSDQTRRGKFFIKKMGTPWHSKECPRRISRRSFPGILPSTTAAMVIANLNIVNKWKDVKGEIKVFSQDFRKTVGAAKIVQETRREERCEHFEPLPFWT